MQAFWKSVSTRNAARSVRIAEERACLRALPAQPLPSYREFCATVSRASIVRVVSRPYSVFSRLVGHRVRVGLRADIALRLSSFSTHYVELAEQSIADG